MYAGSTALPMNDSGATLGPLVIISVISAVPLANASAAISPSINAMFFT